MSGKEERINSGGLQTLSVCMIVRDEAEILGRCLASIIGAADEIIVVDTGSTDESIAVARQFSATVVEEPWCDDFSFSRNISVDHAKGTWILWLDADDIVPPESIPLINRLKRQSPDRVYSFVVRNERPGNTGTEFLQARMFPNMKQLRFERRIHEQIMPSALRSGMKLEKTEVVVEHHGYADSATLKVKAKRNVDMLLKEYPSVAPDMVMALEIADSFWLIDEPEAASEWYRTVLDIHGATKNMPTLAGHARFGLGNICNRREEYKKAIDHFLEAAELTPWRPDVFYGLAVAQELDGDPAAAVTSLRKIAGITPKAGQVGVDFRAAAIKSYLRLIRLLVELGREDELKVLLPEALERTGHRPEIHIMAGKYYLKTGSLMEALHAFERSLRIRREGNIDAYIGLCLVYRAAHYNSKVTETLDAIAPLFSENVRYTVAYRIFTGSWKSGSAALDEEEFRKKRKLLERDFMTMLEEK